MPPLRHDPVKDVPESDKAAFDAALGDPVHPIGAWDMPALMKGKGGEMVPLTSWDRTKWLKDHEDELRSRAAEIAVDMETGVWPGWEKDPATGKGRPFVKAEIAEAMGFSRASGTLSFARDPEFARVVEWERVKREANYRMTVTDARPILNVAISALLLETTRRALESPRSFKNGELLDATRKYIALWGELDGGAQKPKNVRETVNLFIQNVNLLPEAARQKALGLFQNEIKSITALAERVQDTAA